MKTKLLFLSLIMLMGFSVSTYAQGQDPLNFKKSRVLNLNVGVVPYGLYAINVTDYHYKFKSACGFNLALEKEDKIMLEFSLNKGAFDKFEHIDNSKEDLSLPKEKDVFEAGLNLYGGGNLLKSKKFNICPYFGLGLYYIKGDEIDNIAPDLAAKLRIKYYINYKVAFFAGASAHIAGWSIKKKYDDDMARKSVMTEIGAIIDLK